MTEVNLKHHRIRPWTGHGFSRDNPGAWPTNKGKVSLHFPNFHTGSWGDLENADQNKKRCFY